jgi:CBS domain containing-hemolysin-like protein
LTPDGLLWLVIGAALLACISAIGVRALREYSRHDLEEICQRKQHASRFSTILRNDDRVILGVEMVSSGAGVLTVIAGCAWVAHYVGQGELWTGQMLTLLVFSFGIIMIALCIWLPWSISRLGAATFVYHTWPVWRFLSLVASPLVWCACLIDAIFHRVAGRAPEEVDEESFGEEIRTIVSEGQREGLLEEDAREMIEGVIELGDGDVSQIMTPRTDMHMVQVETDWEAMLADVIDCGHTRVPVYEKTRDDIVGILYVKDLLPEFAKSSKEDRKPLVDLLRKPLFVPETKAVDDLLEMFQQIRTHMAVVLDEYGGVSGLVTIEDVLEEIVGEIVDEYDAEFEEEIKVIGEGICEALGRAHIDEINEQMGLALPEDEDYDTIGGFVFTELGRVPIPGEEVSWQESVQVTVLEASRRRIDRVRIERLSKDSREIA